MATDPKVVPRSKGVRRRILGWSMLAVGAALLVLPGPGLPLVAGGLALLAPHYRWARRLLVRVRAAMRRASRRFRQRRRRVPTVVDACGPARASAPSRPLRRDPASVT